MSSCCRSARTRVSDVFLTVLCCEKSAWRTCHDSVQMNAGQAETVNHHMAPLDGLPDRCDLLQQGEGAITHLSRRDQSEGSLARSAGKKKKGAYFYLVSRHFVPGYFHLVPPGQDPLFRCKVEGATWRRLKVTFPDTIKSLSPTQITTPNLVMERLQHPERPYKIGSPLRVRQTKRRVHPLMKKLYLIGGKASQNSTG